MYLFEFFLYSDPFSLLDGSSSIFNNIINPILVVVLIHLSVDEELRKHAKIQEKRAQAAEQPTQVDQDISAVNSTGLAGSAFASMLTVMANGVESKDAEDVGQVSNTREKEEEGIETLGTLATVVEQ